MKDLKKIINLTFWMMICFLILSEAVGKAQVRKMSAKDLTEASTAVLYGKCKKVKSEWNDKKDIIMTYVTIVPEEYIKGNLGSEAVIAVPGGQVGDIRYEVSDMPIFTEGEEVVAFVWTNRSGRNLITGGFQGKMKIEKDSKTGQSFLQGVGIMDDSEAQAQEPGQIKKARKMLLEEFLKKLKSYLKH